MPRPRKLNAATAKIVAPASRLSWTATGPMVPGNRCRMRMRRWLAPVAWAAHRESRGARLWERPALVAALAGTASGEELAARRWPLYARQEDLERVLLERRPPWIRDWMEFELPRRPRLWRFFLGLAQAGCFEPGTSEA